jgi:hypothetical protein
MSTFPQDMIRVLATFAPLFSQRVWHHAQILLAGAILTPARRTVAASLRVMGLADLRQFHRYHRVLSHARWSGLAASRVLLRLLVTTFAPTGPLLFGIDETIERRWGKRIAAKGIYRDPVRSSRSHVVKASGLRWVCAMLLVRIPWAERSWALPVLTALAPSERYNQEQGRRHKSLTDWARQLLRQLRRWWPERELIAVADSTYAAIELLASCQKWARPVTVITRLRLDAALYDPAPRRPGQRGRPPLKGKRQPTLAACATDPSTCWTPVSVPHWYGTGERTIEIASATAIWYHTGLPPVPMRWVLIRDPDGQFAPQALLCTAQETPPAQIVAWFVQRWHLEVTFEEARRHLGLETQRQWSASAIQRTTPALLGLYSLVTLLAHPHFSSSPRSVPQAAWYRKERPTFSDALAIVRRDLWQHALFLLSPARPDRAKIPRCVVERLTEALCYAA